VVIGVRSGPEGRRIWAGSSLSVPTPAMSITADTIQSGSKPGREHPDLLIGTMEQATGNRSATSALVCVPARRSSIRRSSWAGLSLGSLPENRPVDLATFKPSHVLNLVRSDSIMWTTQRSWPGC